MVVIQTEKELISTFRPRDRKWVEPPKGMRFPLTVEHYHSWSDPTGVHGFMVLQKPGWKSAAGLVFERSNGSAHSPARMCEWCHSTGPSDQIGMLTVRVSSKRIIGIILCLDLSCQEKLETVASLTGQKADKLTAGMLERMGRFFDRVFKAPPEEKAAD
jgi:hypothetical protein